MFLLSFDESDDVMVLALSIVSMMLGCLTSNWFLSSSTTSERNILRLQVFCTGSHSIYDESWLLMTKIDVEVLFCRAIVFGLHFGPTGVEICEIGS